jgi:hypothetical protein
MTTSVVSTPWFIFPTANSRRLPVGQYLVRQTFCPVVENVLRIVVCAIRFQARFVSPCSHPGWHGGETCLCNFHGTTHADLYADGNGLRLLPCPKIVAEGSARSRRSRNAAIIDSLHRRPGPRRQVPWAIASGRPVNHLLWPASGESRPPSDSKSWLARLQCSTQRLQDGIFFYLHLHTRLRLRAFRKST